MRAFLAWVDHARQVLGKWMAQYGPTAADLFARISLTTKALLEAPRVNGYEQFFVDEGFTPSSAHLMSQVIIRLGRAYRAEIIANRELASAVGEIARVKRATALVVSRRARRLVKLLDTGSAGARLREACGAAGLTGREQSATAMTLNRGPVGAHPAFAVPWCMNARQSPDLPLARGRDAILSLD